MHFGFWGWFLIIVAIIILGFVVMNLRDIFRYMRIRAM